jgi:cytochrome c556
MQRRLTWRHRQVFFTICACAMAAAVATRAQQAPVSANIVPVSASSLVLHPELYMGQTVAIYATIEQILSATTFSMDQDAKKPSLKDLFVVAPTLQTAPKAGDYMTVVGVVMRFDPAEVQKRARSYTLDVPANVAERYRGAVMVLATSVVDPKMIDLAKVPPAPLTPEEEAFDRVMKQVNAANPELRKGVDASDQALVKAQAALLVKLFTDTRKFFEARGGAPDAVAWATEGIAVVATIEKAASANQWDSVKESAAKLGPLCQSCHTAYRVRGDDGLNRVKPKTPGQ